MYIVAVLINFNIGYSVTRNMLAKTKGNNTGHSGLLCSFIASDVSLAGLLEHLQYFFPLAMVLLRINL